MLNGDVAARAQPRRASALLGSELTDPHIDPTGKLSGEFPLEPTPPSHLDGLADAQPMAIDHDEQRVVANAVAALLGRLERD